MVNQSWKLRPKDWQEKQAADRKANQERKKALIPKLAVKTTKPISKPKKEKYNRPNQPVKVINSLATERSARPWANVRGVPEDLKFFSGTEEHDELQIQPWAQEIVSVLLQAADEGGIHLCLTWPVCFHSLAILHAIANLKRNQTLDFRGLRTLFYPSTHNSRSVLQTVLVERTKLSDLYRFQLSPEGDGSKISTQTDSKSFMAMLEALNDIRWHHAEVENPSLAEIIPTFMYEPTLNGWVSSVKNPLERSLKKVERLAHRRNIREKVNKEWGNPKLAPGALMFMHYSSRKDTWKQALSDFALKDEGKPEVLLIDATSTAESTNYSAVRRIPDFIRYARDNGYQDQGAVIVTDDPKTFFVMRARLNELKLSLTSRVWAAESSYPIFSANALPLDWKPELRSNSNFSVGIVDRDASQVAMAFQRLAQDSGMEDSENHKSLMAACLYLLRLSNLPAGYSDLTSVASQEGTEEFGSQRNAWTPIKLGIMAVLQSGALNAKREDADRVVAKAEQLIDLWSDATPMAARLLMEVRKHAIERRAGLSIVLPNKKYIQLAFRFLQRKLGDEWIKIEKRLDWHTLSSVASTLAENRGDRSLIFVGINHNVLRMLLTNLAIPHGTTVLIAYKQADSTLITLSCMKEMEAFKPYRGRIGLLAQELDRRLKEVPNPIVIGKLGELKLTFKLEENNQQYSETDQEFYKFDLEGGDYVSVAGWVYRFNPDEDPFFSRVSASSIKVGDSIFEMSDELRSKLESALDLGNDGLGSVVYPQRTWLKLYHDDVRLRCDLLFSAKRRTALAKEILSKMVEIDPKVSECRPARIYYWLALKEDGDTRPHAPKDSKYFKIFCKALQMSEDDALRHWNFIRSARQLNIDLGRELSLRYAEILFRPESAAINRKVAEEVIKQLRQEALSCVYLVEKVRPPQSKAH
jgi:hypothetical protein